MGRMEGRKVKAIVRSSWYSEDRRVLTLTTSCFLVIKWLKGIRMVFARFIATVLVFLFLLLILFTRVVEGVFWGGTEFSCVLGVSTLIEMYWKIIMNTRDLPFLIKM